MKVTHPIKTSEGDEYLVLIESMTMYTSGNGKPKQLTEQKADKQQKKLSKKVDSIIIFLLPEEGKLELLTTF
jgi:hypothetical protein